MNNIVLIVGAGASSEFCVPTGSGLINEIVKNIGVNPNYRADNKEGEFKDLVNQYFVYADREPITEEIRTENRRLFNEVLIDFKEKLKPWGEKGGSIDTFLKNHSDKTEYEDFGKFAIAYYIIGSEEWLMRENLYAFKKNWFRVFLENHFNPGLRDLIEEKIKLKIITFNYDRIIEHFVYNFLRHSTVPPVPGWNEEDGSDKSREIAKKLGIIHVYNKLAYLEWEDRLGESIRFGERNNDKGHLTYASQRIRLIAETGKSRISEDKVTALREIIANAGKIYLLGFGFDKENMEILFGDQVDGKNFKRNAICHATAFNLAPEIKKKYAFINYHDQSSCASLVEDSNIFKIG